MRILITGSRGFIGSSVGEFAAAAGHEVFGLGRASNPVSGWRGGYRQTDVATSDLVDVIENFSPDVVLHAAGSASVATSIQAPFDDFRAATLTCANVLDSIRRSRLNPLVILPSSAAVYGNPLELPINEDLSPQPISPYGFHKWACEVLAHEYAKCFAMRMLVCRLFSVFGPRQNRLLVWEVFQQTKSSKPTIELQGSGLETRDYLHVDDVADAMLQLAAISGAQDLSKPLVVNLASGKEVQVIELARMIARLVAPEKEINCRGIVRAGDPQFWQADVSRLRGLLPRWKPGAFNERLSQCLNVWSSVNTMP